MNERIRQLAQEAGMYVGRVPRRANWMSGEECEAAYKKFAELIVQECVSLCEVETTVTDLPEYNIGIIEGYRRARENMLGYFGVKNEPA